VNYGSNAAGGITDVDEDAWNLWLQHQRGGAERRRLAGIVNDGVITLTALTEALRRRFRSPREVMSALGLDYRLLVEGNNMAFDYHQDRARFRAAATRAALLRAAGGNPRMIL
jgi:hypothetical protein